MAKQIKGKDIIEDQHLDNAIKQADLLVASYKKLDAIVIKTAKDIKKASSATGQKSAAGIQKTSQALKASNTLKKEAIAIDKKIEKGQAQLTLAYSRQAKQLANQQLLQKRRNQLAKEEAVLNSKSSSTYEKLSIELNRNRKALKELILTEGSASKATKAMQKEVARLDSRLKKADAAAGQFQRSVGGYRQAIGGAVSSLKNFASALGVVGGVRLLTNVLRDSFNIVKDFGQSQADLASVLGKNVDEIKELTATAKELGATTKFTASEVANLQLEFAKLGFPEEEIQNMTKATLELAAASGTDLANAATIVGSTLNAFGLESTDTQRLVDVMAKSFSSSSLDIDKFSSAMSNVAPAAAAVGLTIEETTALIGTLTDAGNDAGAAGTGLRNMFIQAKTKGIEFDDALEQIANSSDQLTTSFDLFGKKGATLGVTLANNRDGAAALTEKLEGAAGAAGEMADKQLDTLNGSLALLRSAWEGYILGADGAGGASDKLKKIVKFLADNLETILDTVLLVTKAFVVYKVAIFAQTVALRAYNVIQTLATKGLKAFTKAAKVNPFALIVTALIVVLPLLRDFVDNLFGAEEQLGAVAEAQKVVNTELAKESAKLKTKFDLLKQTQPHSEARLRMINDINDTYGTTLENMEDEVAFAEQLKIEYEALNKQLEKKIKTRVFEAAAENLIAQNIRLNKSFEDLKAGLLSQEDLEDLADEFDVSVLDLATGELGNLFQQNVKDIDALLADLIELDQVDPGLPITDGLEDLGDKARGATKEVKELNDEIKREDIAKKKRPEIEKLQGAELDAQIKPVSAFVQAMIDANKKIAADRKKRIEELKKFRDESIKIFEDITNARVRELDKQIAKKQEDVNDSKTAIQNLQTLAAQGNTDAAEAIKAERIRLAKDKLDIEKLEKKKRNLLIQVTALQSANSLFEQGNAGAFKQAGGAIQDFLAGLPQFFDGTEGTVADSLGRTGTRDGHLARVHDNEHIIGAKDSDSLHKAGFSKTSDIVSAAMASQNNSLTKKAMLMSGGLSFTDAGIISELREVKEAISNMEHPTSIYDPETGKETIRKGDTTETYHHKPNTFRI